MPRFEGIPVNEQIVEGRFPGIPIETAPETTREQLTALDQGQITSADLTPEQRGAVRFQRLEDIPEIGTGSGLLAGTDPSQRAAFAAALPLTFDPQEMGQMLESQFPEIGVAYTPEGRVIARNNQTGAVAELNKPGLSTLDVLQGLGVISAFAPGASLAAGATRGAPLALRAAAQGLAAGAGEVGLQAGQAELGGEFDPGDIAAATGLGAAAEVALPAARAAFRGGRRLVSGADETAEQAARREILEPEIGPLTRPQVTRDATEFQTQQELAKRSGPVRARLEQQEARLQGAFEQQAVDTQGNVITSTSTPIDEVLNRSIEQDQVIGDLYQAARESLGDEAIVETNRLNRAINSARGLETKSKGVVSAIQSILRNNGVLEAPQTVVTAQGLRRRVFPRVSVRQAESIRQEINTLFQDSNFTGKNVIRRIKDALDEDVLSQAGEDVFEQARASKRAYELALEKAKVSKFDTTKNNLVRDMLENKVNPDTFINDVVFAKKWRTDDLNQLRLYLTQTDSGAQAWNDIRAQVVDEIQSRSFTGPVLEDGVTQSLSRASLEKTLDKLSSKMNVLFSQEERQFFNRMREVARLREPTKATALGKGPSAQAVGELKNRFPILGGLFDSLSTWRQNRLMMRLPRARGPQLTRTLPGSSLQPLRSEEE